MCSYNLSGPKFAYFSPSIGGLGVDRLLVRFSISQSLPEILLTKSEVV